MFGRLLSRVMLVSLLAALSTSALIAAGGPLELDFSPSPLDRLLADLAARTETVTCPRVARSPVIDGALDDAAWEHAGTLGLTNNRPRTSIRVCYDGKALYVGVIATEPPGPRPDRAFQEHDGNRIWKDEHVEIWIDPSRKGDAVYQFVLGVSGAFYDLRGNSTRYNPEWQRATKVGKGRWVAEIALPLKALGLDAWPKRLAFNIGRNGPALTFRSWNKRYGGTDGTELALQGARGRPRETGPAGAAGKGRPAATAEGASLQVVIDRPVARAQDRWIEGVVSLQPTRVPLKKTRLVARLYGLDLRKPVAESAITPPRRKGRIGVDLRSVNLRKACLVVELFEGKACTGRHAAFLTARTCETPFAAGRRARIIIDPPKSVSGLTRGPVHFGVPFAAGALWDARALRLVDGRGRPLPFQTEVTGLWSRDGAIKWVRFDALVTPGQGCFVQAAPVGDPTAPATPLTLTQRGDTITVNTGVSRYVLGKGSSPIREIRLGGKPVAGSNGVRGLYLVDQKGRVASASADGETMRIEARGPVASCVRFEGWYATKAGEKLARHITRVECFAGQPHANITHTLVLTQDTNKTWFKDMGWEFAVRPGADPTAAFGLSRDDWRKVRTCKLDARTPSAYMLQDRHYRFAGGTNHCRIASVPARGAEKVLAEGEECGDWGALSGGAAGLALHCGEAARQHPKEFEASKDRITLRLFSNRAGEEMDFRSPTLVKKWNLAEWNRQGVHRARYDKNMPAKIAKIRTNAAGWAKTHELCVMPLPGRATPLDTARAAALQSSPVYAHVDPEWVWRSEVMGPIHPRDPKRFPHAEKALDATLDWWHSRVPAFGEWGFMDYYIGPHIWYRGKGRKFPNLTGHGYRYSYTLRHYLWLVYARSAQRRLYDFTRETNRVFMDAYMAHWDTPTKTKGLYAAAGMGDRPDGKTTNALPFTWGSRTSDMISSSTDLNQFIWLYHVAGYRRAKDCMLDYANGIKRSWTLSKPKRCFRAIMLLRTLTQCYAFTWDPALRAMAEMTGDHLCDPESDVRLTKDRPYSGSPYKTGVDIAGLVEALEVFGERRYRDAALAVSRFWWDRWVGHWPIFYVNHQGLIGNFLYRQTGDRSVVEMLKIQMNQAAASYDPKTGKLSRMTKRPAWGASAVTFMLEGIPYTQDLIVRSGALGKSLASWVAYNDYGNEASVVVYKGDKQLLEFNVSSGALSQMGVGKGKAGGIVRLEPLTTTDKVIGSANLHQASDLNTVVEKASGAAYVRLPKDAPYGASKIRSLVPGHDLFVLCRSKAPLVLHAPSYWKPLPAYQRPYGRVYFKAPKKAQGGQIFFEGSARLWDPSGAAFAGGKPQHGWIDLPDSKPGLWSFKPVENMLVRVRNLPPFFAFSDPAHYFEPDIPWEREEPPPEPAKVSPRTVYVPGAIGTKGNQALYIGGRRTLTLQAGEKHPSGVGGRFLPFHEGTIECFLKPDWSTFDLKAKFVPVFRLNAPRHPWYLQYLNDPDRNPETSRHVLLGIAYTDGPLKRITFRCYRRQTVFERSQWAHVAWVWGRRDGIYTVRGKTNKDVLMMRIYVNGKPGNSRFYKLGRNLPADEPRQLVMDYRLRSAVDELRVSDCQRYFGDFTPPSRAQEFKVDRHTRALFHFNGNVEGESYGHTGPLPVRLKP